jgi:hypothetical protein
LIKQKLQQYWSSVKVEEKSKGQGDERGQSTFILGADLCIAGMNK